LPERDIVLQEVVVSTERWQRGRRAAAPAGDVAATGSRSAVSP